MIPNRKTRLATAAVLNLLEEDPRNYVTSRHSLMPLGLTARNSGKNRDRPKPRISNLTLRPELCQEDSKSSRKAGAHGGPPHRNLWVLRTVGSPWPPGPAA